MGCVQKYQSEPFLAYGTTATLAMGQALQKQSSNQQYAIFTDAYCNNSEHYGLAANLTYFAFTDKQEVVHLQPDTELFVVGRAAKHHNGEARECTNVSRFIAEQGKAYLVEQHLYWPQCSMKIIDLATQAEVGQPQKVTDKCRKKNLTPLF
ncbi:MAG: hypothetical protein R3183_05700 [Oleiphilaceae bacterium]|nr:hypothetical protein [Oleiphilaceae bacterium]